MTSGLSQRTQSRCPFAQSLVDVGKHKEQYSSVLDLCKLKGKKLIKFILVFIKVVAVLQIVLHREEEVLECECDMAMVHHLLSQIPQDLPYETLISRAGDLFVQFPPSELAREAASHDRYLTP